MPPLPADSIHARACKLKCEKILTRPVVDNRPEELLAGISAAFAPRPQMGQAVPPGSTP